MEVRRSEYEILWGTPRVESDEELRNSAGRDDIHQNIVRQQRSSGGSSTWRTSQIEQEAQAIEAQLLKIGCSPITDGDRSKAWNLSRLKYYTDYALSMKLAKNSIKLKFASMSIPEYQVYYENSFSYIWGAVDGSSVDKKYFTVDVSTFKIFQLLIFQFHRASLSQTYTIIDNKWRTPVFAYLRNLFKFINRQNGKKNTQYYLSGPCSGKTFWFNCIRDFLLNTGNMSNWNRSSQFPMQMCVDVRLIFWNGPNVEPSALED